MELTEDYFVNLLSGTLFASGRDVTVLDNQGVATITNDDSATLSIDNVTQSETDGLTTFTFTVSSTTQVDTNVTVNYETADNSAQDLGSGAGSDDYKAASDTSTITAGTTSTTIDVTVNGDDVVELTEDFFVNLLSGTLLANGRDVTVLDNQGVGTITHDDSATLSINDVTQIETDGVTTFIFSVTSTAQIDTTVSATVNTIDGTAQEGGAGPGSNDYEVIVGGNVSLAAGSTSQNINVTVNGDDVTELDENFFVMLSNLVANGRDVTLLDSSGEGTILNDDFTPVADAGGPYEIDEGDGLTLDGSGTTDDDSAALTYQWDVDGDGDYDENVTGVSPTLTPAQMVSLGLNDGPDSRTITVLVSDGTNSDTDTATLTINNVEPTLSLDDVSAIVERGTATLTGTIADPGTADTFKLEVNWGDPNSPNNVETYLFSASSTGIQSFTLTHQYVDDNPTITSQDEFTINVRVTDDNLESDSDSEKVLVRNVDPDITSVNLSSIHIDEAQSVTVSGTFTDAALGVSTETFSGTALWSDGATTSVTIVGGSYSTTRAFPDDHPMSGTAFDQFTVKVTIRDDDSGSDTAISAPVTVRNIAPEIVSLNLSSASINEGQSVTASGTFSDPALAFPRRHLLASRPGMTVSQQP